jgi:Mor family transcriptional regulator
MNHKIKRNHKGYRVGEFHQAAKLTDAQVEEIRKRYLAYVRGYEKLAREYGCSVSTVRDIVQHRTRA